MIIGLQLAIILNPDYALENLLCGLRECLHGIEVFYSIIQMVNLPIEYSDKSVTPFGGMAVMKRFLDQVGIHEKLGTLDLPSPGSNRGYSAEQIIENFWLNVWTGASRYVHCNWLREDAVIRDIFGFNQMPSQSTYSRFFGKFSQQRNHAVFPQLQKWFFDQIDIGAVTIDFDSTVITREGKREGAALGYNPNRRGRNSHHPLLAFVSETKMVANAWQHRSLQ